MKCGGACEYTKIAGLLPGEERYIAEKLNLSLEEFIYSYLDGVKVDEHIINIIRCSNPCPFLKNDYSCAIKEFKPVLCLIYPSPMVQAGSLNLIIRVLLHKTGRQKDTLKIQE
jgi:uncharacterized protein